MYILLSRIIQYAGSRKQFHNISIKRTTLLFEAKIYLHIKMLSLSIEVLEEEVN